MLLDYHYIEFEDLLNYAKSIGATEAEFCIYGDIECVNNEIVKYKNKVLLLNRRRINYFNSLRNNKKEENDTRINKVKKQR